MCECVIFAVFFLFSINVACASVTLEWIYFWRTREMPRWQAPQPITNGFKNKTKRTEISIADTKRNFVVSWSMKQNRNDKMRIKKTRREWDRERAQKERRGVSEIEKGSKGNIKWEETNVQNDTFACMYVESSTKAFLCFMPSRLDGTWDR